MYSFVSGPFVYNEWDGVTYVLLWQNIYFPILGKALNELDLLFSDENIVILCVINVPSPKTDGFL